MYYIVADSMIVDCSSKQPSQADLQRWVNATDANIYVIRGEHAGLTAEPNIVRMDEEHEQAMLIADDDRVIF